MKSFFPPLMVLFISACAHVKISDLEFCGDLGESGAACARTLTDTTRTMDKEQWDAERYGQICTQSKSFAELKTAIEQLCDLTKRCSYETKQEIDAFFTKISTLENP